MGSSNASVLVSGNRLVYRLSDDKTGQVLITELEYAYAVVNRLGQPRLMLFDGQQHHLPTDLPGFSQAYQELTRQLGFDDHAFFQATTERTPGKQEIWRKPRTPTYQLLPGTWDDYAQGFEVQSPRKQMISWDTPREEELLLKNFSTRQFGDSQRLTALHPVRIGSILLHGFASPPTNGRSDAPLLRYFANCYHKSSSDISYRNLKARMMRDFPAYALNTEHRGSYNLSFSADLQGMRFSISYHYDSPYSFEGGYTLFSVENRREYPKLLDNSAYESVMEVSSFLLITEEVSTGHQYRQNSTIKRRPSALPGNKAVVWADERNAVLGFADAGFCQTFPLADIEELRIQNVLPAKGPGGGYLSVALRGAPDKAYAVMKGKCRVFDRYAAQLQRLTGRPLRFAPEWHDC